MMLIHSTELSQGEGYILVFRWISTCSPLERRTRITTSPRYKLFLISPCWSFSLRFSAFPPVALCQKFCESKCNNNYNSLSFTEEKYQSLVVMEKLTLESFRSPKTRRRQ